VASFLTGILQASIDKITLKTIRRGKKVSATGTPNRLLYMGEGQ
jgi:hypothetical protein